MSNWLDDLKPGDYVASGGNSWNPPVKMRVARTTKTLIITDNGTRWRRDTGSATGKRSGRLIMYDESVRYRIEFAKLQSWMFRLYRTVLDARFRPGNTADMELLAVMRRVKIEAGEVVKGIRNRGEG